MFGFFGGRIFFFLVGFVVVDDYGNGYVNYNYIEGEFYDGGGKFKGYFGVYIVIDYKCWGDDDFVGLVDVVCFVVIYDGEDIDGWKY